jgi:CelD/BcsL family acetyltransferase involved in cellulose biosynthesis
MTAATRPPEGAFHDPSADKSRVLARIEVFDSLEAAAPAWRTLEAGDALATAYQRIDFLALWQRHIGAHDGIAPCIAVGYDADGAPAALLPLGRHSMHSLKVLGFLGGKHSNFNLGVWRRDIAAAMTDADLRSLLTALAGHGDALILYNQPMRWQDIANPLAALPQHPAPSMAYRGPLRPDFEELLKERTSNSTRYKMRKKVKALTNKAGPVAFARAEGPEAARRVVREFFAQKSARMQAMGMEDVFGATDVRAFIEAGVCASLPDGKPLIEIYELTAGGAIVATMGGMVRDGRFSAMFNSIPAEKFRSESPGEQLLVNLIRACCERGLNTFDLGVGEASYKDMFCPDEEPLFDTYLPLSGRGHALVAIERAKSAMKRTIKQNRSLWTAVIRARQWRAALSRKS